MKSQAYFEKIHKHIENNLLTANESIRIAVAWFTDAKLFKILCSKAKEGLKIELLIARHDINFDSTLNYNDLVENGGKLYWIGDDGHYAPLMHNKFCIIDNKVLLFGSYNWTQRAKSNHESITIIEEDTNLILDFNQEFDKIKNKYYNIDAIIDWQKIIKLLFFLIKNRDYKFFLYNIFSYFPISYKTLQKYEDVVEWNGISRNTKFNFTAQILNKYSEKWYIYELASNKNVNWNLDLIKKHENEIDWRNIYLNQLCALPWSNEILKMYEKKIDWWLFSSYEWFPWNEEFIDNYSSKINWNSLSYNKSIPWSEKLILKYKNKLNWKELSANNNLPWSIEFFEEYINLWDWKNLSKNNGLPWSLDFFIKYDEHWCYESLSENKGIKWDIVFFNKFISYNGINWRWLSRMALPWSKELILKHSDKWDWKLLTINTNIAWNEDMISSFIDKIDWKFSFHNKSLFLNIDNFSKIQDIIHLDDIFFERIIELIEPYIDDKLIEDLVIESLKESKK